MARELLISSKNYQSFWYSPDQPDVLKTVHLLNAFKIGHTLSGLYFQKAS